MKEVYPYSPEGVKPLSEARDRETMKRRYEELNWEWNDENFNNWYRGSKYAAKAVCEKLRRSSVG